MSKLSVGHAAMECKGSDEDDVLDAGIGRTFKDRLDDVLAYVRSFHLGKW
jgi:hypothetical protein